jgi:hypothetical protein
MSDLSAEAAVLHAVIEGSETTAVGSLKDLDLWSREELEGFAYSLGRTLDLVNAEIGRRRAPLRSRRRS